MRQIESNEFLEKLKTGARPKVWLSPNLDIWLVNDHEPDAWRLSRQLYDNRHAYNPNDSWMDRWSCFLYERGWLRVVDHGDGLEFSSSTPARSQARKFLMLAAKQAGLSLTDLSKASAQLLYDPAEAKEVAERMLSS